MYLIGVSHPPLGMVSPNLASSSHLSANSLRFCICSSGVIFFVSFVVLDGEHYTAPSGWLAIGCRNFLGLKGRNEHKRRNA